MFPISGFFVGEPFGHCSGQFPESISRTALAADLVARLRANRPVANHF